MDNERRLWLEAPDPGWDPVSPPFLALEDSFLAGDTTGHRLSIRYYRKQGDASLRAKVLFGSQAQGPPGHAHGGAMAAIMDEAMGGAAWMAGHPVVAARLQLEFQEMLPLDARCLVKAEITAVEGRKVRTTALLGNLDGSCIYCRATGLFIILDRSQLDRMPASALDIVKHLDPDFRPGPD